MTSATRALVTILAALAALAGASPVNAQQRPFTTEDPVPIGARRVALEVGAGYGRAVEIPLYGLDGHLLQVPIGVSIGLGSQVELQFDSGVQSLAITSRYDAPFSFILDIPGTRSTAPLDLVVATKIRVLQERENRPGLGLRIATRLPNASNQTGLGPDTLDFTASLLAGKTVGATRVVANVGVGIFEDPLRASLQNDALVYGVSIAREIHGDTEVVAEVAGRTPSFSDDTPPGAEGTGVVRAGLRRGWRAWRIDGGVLLGLTPRDPDWGVFAGATLVLERR